MALRRYLLNGGFLMVDDFWGDGRVRELPRADQARLPRAASRSSCPSSTRSSAASTGSRKSRRSPASAPQYRAEGITYERHGGSDEQVHYRGIFDDKGRMMVIICHNTDLGDGWEREGQSPGTSRSSPRRKAYPMGINIVTYAMTH